MVGYETHPRAFHHLVVDTQPSLPSDDLPVTYDEPFPTSTGAKAMADYYNGGSPGRFRVIDLGAGASKRQYIRRELTDPNDPGIIHEHGITDGTHSEGDGGTPALK